MDNIWSGNKYINLVVNILLFLTGINFLHYGQLILPVICFLLFIDSKLKFKVNDSKTFILFCLFSVSFYAFTYQMGFYCVMGFTLPMAYYIGSNMKEPSEDNIRKIVYLFAISMGCHVILNSIYEYIVHGYHGFFLSSTHYDIWTREKIANTTTAVNLDVMIGCIYYLIFHEKNKKLRSGSLIVFALSMFYLLVIGRRTPVLLIFVVLFCSFVFESFILKSDTRMFRKDFLIIAVCLITLITLIVIIYSLNLFDCQALLDNYYIIRKFKQGLISDRRFALLFGSFKLMPIYPFGGQHISSTLGDLVHDFWIDIYDYAGIIPYILMVICSILHLIVDIKTLKSKQISSDFKIFILGVMVCIIVQMFFEPVMTGSSLFLLVAIMINAFVERLMING